MWVRFFESYSKKVQFFGSEKEKFNSYWEEVHKRGSIQWVIYKEFNSLSHWKNKRGFNSLSHFLGWIFFFKKKIQFGTHTKKGSILWVKWLKKSSILWVQCKKSSTLSVKFKKVFNTLSHFLWKILLFLDSTRLDGSAWHVNASWDNWLTIHQKRVQFESCKKVIHTEERFNSLSILKKFNSLSHIGKQERFNSSRHIEKKDFNSLSHIEKRFIKRGSILWIF